MIQSALSIETKHKPMRVKVQSPEQGIRNLWGPVVILDVFRASNTVLALLEAGITQVFLVSGLVQAQALKEARPDWLLWGGRDEDGFDGFEGDNSPVLAGSLELQYQSVILTATAGVRPVQKLGRVGPVLLGSFANAGALFRGLKTLGFTEVNLIPVGLASGGPADEDDLAAEYLSEFLSGGRPDFSATKSRLRACSGAERMRSLGLKQDLAYCTSLDTSSLVPVVRYSGVYPTAVGWCP